MGVLRRRRGNAPCRGSLFVIVFVALVTSACGASQKDGAEAGAGNTPSNGGGASSVAGSSPADGGSSLGGRNGGTAGTPDAARGGGAGEAGEPGCDAATIASCNDGNDCTADQLDDDCACSHNPLPDGAECDDGNVCTERDECASGACSGLPSSTTPSVVGSLQSFGSNPGLQTLVAFPTDDRAVFATTRRLSLVALDADAVRPLDDLGMGAVILSDNVGSMIWVARPRTFLIPVLDHHVAVVGQNWGIDLFDLAGDRLAASERYGFDASESQIRAAAGGGSRIFTCISNELRAWSIDTSNFLITRGSTLRLPTGHVCQGLSFAADTNTLYAATSRGLDRVDVSNPDGSMTLGTGARDGQVVVDVDAGAGYVVIFEVRQATSGFGDVIVLSRDTLEEVTTFAADLNPGGIVPAGFSLLDDGRLLLQRLHADGCLRINEAALFNLGSPSTEIGSLGLLHACDSPFVTPAFQTVARGRHAVLEPMHQIARIDAGGSAPIPLTSPRQGSFERVRAAGPSALAVYGPGSVHRVDISDPSAPRVEAGGPVSPLDLEWLRLDLTDPGAPAFVTVKDAAVGPLAGPVTTVLRANDSGLPEASGSIGNDDPDGTWVSAGHFLYQLSPNATASFRIREFSAFDVTRSAGQALVPDLDQVLTTEPPAALDVRQTPLFAVDSESGDLVVAEPRFAANGSRGVVLSWFSRANTDFERAFGETLDAETPLGFAVAKGRAVMAFSDRLIVVSRDQSPETVRFDTTAELTARSVLDFDGNQLVLGASFRTPALTEGVLVLQADDFSELARYSTPEPVLSFAAVGNHLAFGSKSTLSIATPACP